MHICFFTHYTALMGANRSMLELVSKLSAMGHEITVITNGIGDINKELSALNIRCKNFRFYSWMRNGSSLREWLFNKIKYLINIYAEHQIIKYLSGKKIDIVHTNTSVIDIGSRVAKCLSKPHIWHIREYGNEDYNCQFIGDEHSCVKYMDDSSAKVIFISKDLEKKYLSINPEFKHNTVIYNGVELNNYFVQRNQSDYENKIKIVVCGLISPNKNQLEVLKAIYELPSQYKKQVECLIIGGGDENYINKLKRYVKDNSLSSHVIFLGYRGDVQEILKNAHIAVVPSKREAFGRVTVEYMLSGLGVVVSNRGANEEIVDNYKTGVVYCLGDVKDLRDKLVYYLEDRKRLYEIATNGQNKAKSMFVSNINAENINKVYKEIINSRL